MRPINIILLTIIVALAARGIEKCTEIFNTRSNSSTEIPVIRKAAERNGIKVGADDWFLLLAIRKAENGRKGCEFGIKHPKAWDTDLDTQAGWCSASIVKSRQRWIAAGKPEDFISFMGRRFCPPEAHPLNKHWATNVKYWFKKLRGE